VFTWELGAPCSLSYNTVRRLALPWSVYNLKDINKQKGGREITSSLAIFAPREQRQKRQILKIRKSTTLMKISEKRNA